LIATVDKKHKKIKLSSIMRDTYVKIDGHGMDKITHAYSFGGPQLAIKTINENFNMNIRDFVQVDFFGLQAIIDAMGGITMDIKKEEVKEINNILWELALLENVAPPNITEPGVQLLNGMQAVTYARIRHVGNNDFERTDRQRRVIQVLFEKVKEQGALKFPYIVSQLLPHIETSMDKATILKLGAQVFAGNMLNFEQMRFPLVKATQDLNLYYGYYLWADLKATTNHIHTFIYDDVIPEVKPGDIIEQPPSSLIQKSQSSKPTKKPGGTNENTEPNAQTPAEGQDPNNNQQPSTPDNPQPDQPKTETPQGDTPGDTNTQTPSTPQPPQTNPTEDKKPADTQQSQ
jgi:LCP family protein required for cell wall assembly